jgi:predicted lipoprotein
MPRIAFVIGVFAAAALVAWRFPLFYIVPLEQAAARRQAETFDAQAYALKFWETRLAPELESANDAAEVVAALRSDSEDARRHFGRQVGMSRSSLLFLRGRGTIVSVDNRAVGVALTADSAEPEIVLVTGRIVGNAVRDATGLLSAGDYANSQHFNDLAGELNLLVEAGPVKLLQAAAEIGGAVQFVGCASLAGGRVAWPIKMIPLDVTIE